MLLSGSGERPNPAGPRVSRRSSGHPRGRAPRCRASCPHRPRDRSGSGAARRPSFRGRRSTACCAERACVGEPQQAPEAVLALGHDVGQRRHVRLVRGRGITEREEVVALLGGDLGIGPRPQLGDRQVVDLDGDPVPLAPLPGERLSEPVVVGGDEVRPLGDLQDARRGVGTPAAGGGTSLRQRSRSPRRSGADACGTRGTRHVEMALPSNARVFSPRETRLSRRGALRRPESASVLVRGGGYGWSNSQRGNHSAISGKSMTAAAR